MAKLRPHPDIAEVLITEPRIHQRIATLARDIGRCYDGEEVTIITVLNGSIVFLGELLHRLPMPTRLDSIVARSYGASTTSSGRVRTRRPWQLPLKGQHVLLVDDILDTGRTLKLIRDRIRRERPASVRTCVLLDKPTRREVDIHADFTGFEIPDKFVVGYGLDFAERYRNLPYIAVLKPEIYRSRGTE
ncbi:MAG: hypoxanthine phosphoribosyltransferase [Verrucomicrobia bacterium]|nr:hypoxanthine phosphoribosyltransferase [Verrucomicrobiota bacterium]